MNPIDIATSVLASAGGKDNVTTVTSCMTRLRLSVQDMNKVNKEDISALSNVLGVLDRSNHSIEVVFGPAVIKDVYTNFVKLLNHDTKLCDTFVPDRPKGSMNVQISPGRRMSYAAQAKAHAKRLQEEHKDTHTESEPTSEIEELCALLDMQDEVPAPYTNYEVSKPNDNKILVINGPSINLLGIREPDIYGHLTYAHLLDTCAKAAKQAGFSECKCFQSNHEGEIVDEIQHAYKIYNAIVINPAAYTHTSIAILDALRAVNIPTIEVHLSDIDSREEFRRTSYTSLACIKTIKGKGIDGYAQAIKELASYIASNELL